MAKILLVEDDNNLREIYGARLTAEGYEIVAAPDGEEALAIAVKEKPDLIITDVMMPKISGFDMLDILRNAPETKDTKVIMMTALSQAEDKDRADKLGADLYLVKSQVTLEDVAASVKKILGGETAAAAQAPPAETPAPAVPEAPAAVPAPEPAPPVVSTPAPAPEPAPAATTPLATPEPASLPPQDGTNEVKPADTVPVASPPAPEPPAVQPPSTPAPAPAEPPKPEAKKIEVILPDSPAETTPTVEEKPPEPPVSAEPVLQAPIVEAPSVGPNLAEALAEEEKSMGQTGDISDAPASPSASTTPATVIKPSGPPPEEPVAPPLEAPSAGPPINSNTKVIQPIGDPTTGPDLNALLAKEQQSAPPSDSPQPGPPAPPAPDQPDDLSKISL